MKSSRLLLVLCSCSGCPSHLPGLHYGLYPSGDEHGERHLRQIRNDERKYAPPENRKKADASAVFYIDMHEPGRSERVAYDKSEDKRCHFDGDLLPEEFREQHIDKADEQESKDIPAGASEQNSDACAESGEDRCPGCSDQYIHEYGNGSFLATEKHQHEENGKCLKRKRYRCRYAYPGAYCDQCRSD